MKRLRARTTEPADFPAVRTRRHAHRTKGLSTNASPLLARGLRPPVAPDADLGLAGSRRRATHQVEQQAQAVVGHVTGDGGDHPALQEEHT